MRAPVGQARSSRSAAAHGKTWAITEVQRPVGEKVEWQAGQFHTSGTPEPGMLTESLKVTVQLNSAALTRLLQRNGYDPTKECKRAMLVAARRMPQRDGGEHVEGVGRQLGVE